MKTAISIPGEIFKRAERVSKRLGVSRSESFTRAMQEYLGIQRDEAITASCNEAFTDTRLDDLVEFQRKAAASSLLAVEWSDE
jgi:hypothetical protein